MKYITQNTKVLIVGLGLMGGSYAKALTRKGIEVRAVTKEQKDLDFALQNGFLSAGSTTPEKALFDWADVVVLALYPHVLLNWTAENAALFHPGCLITDVTGVKESIVTAMQNLMPPGVEFVSAHPMAGRERSGVAFSDDRVFAGANYIVVPTEKNTEWGIDFCTELGEVLGFSRISQLTAAEHDRMIAFLSQLTHCIAVSLMCATDVPGLETYTGDSFRDLTRIARINDDMWSELFLCNRPALLSAIDKFSSQLETLRTALCNGDREKLRKMMRISSARREKFDKPKTQDVLWTQKEDPSL